MVNRGWEGVPPGSIAVPTASETLPGHTRILPLLQTRENTHSHTLAQADTHFVVARTLSEATSKQVPLICKMG